MGRPNSSLCAPHGKYMIPETMYPKSIWYLIPWITKIHMSLFVSNFIFVSPQLSFLYVYYLCGSCAMFASCSISMGNIFKSHAYFYSFLWHHGPDTPMMDILVQIMFCFTIFISCLDSCFSENFPLRIDMVFIWGKSHTTVVLSICGILPNSTGNFCLMFLRCYGCLMQV